LTRFFCSIFLARSWKFNFFWVIWLVFLGRSYVILSRNIYFLSR